MAYIHQAGAAHVGVIGGDLSGQAILDVVFDHQDGPDALIDLGFVLLDPCQQGIGLGGPEGLGREGKDFIMQAAHGSSHR